MFLCHHNRNPFPSLPFFPFFPFFYHIHLTLQPIMSTKADSNVKIQEVIDSLRESRTLNRDQLHKLSHKFKTCWNDKIEYVSETTRYRKRHVREVGQSIMNENPHLFLPFILVTPERNFRMSAFPKVATAKCHLASAPTWRARRVSNAHGYHTFSTQHSSTTNQLDNV